MMFSRTVLAARVPQRGVHTGMVQLRLSAVRQASGSEPEVQDLQAPVARGWGGRARLQQAAWIVALASMFRHSSVGTTRLAVPDPGCEAT